MTIQAGPQRKRVTFSSARFFTEKPKRKRVLMSGVKSSKTTKRERKTINMSNEYKDLMEFYKKLKIPSPPSRDGCKYIYGDDIASGNYQWCGKKVSKEGSSWCEKHEKVCVGNTYRPEGELNKNGKGKSS